jgi:hypothetical protein
MVWNGASSASLIVAPNLVAALGLPIEPEAECPQLAHNFRVFETR